MITIFNELLYRPLFNLTILLYNIVPGSDFGLAIIFLTILIRVIFFPLSVKTLRSQKALNQLNPKIKEIKDKYKNDQAAQSAAILNLYKENKINPLAGCLPLLVQLPILIALYRAVIAGLNADNLTLLYGFVDNPGVLNDMFLGLISVTAKNPVLALVAGGVQFFQARQSFQYTQGYDSNPANKEMAALNKQMLYFFPIFIIIIGWNLPAGLLLYWITTTVFSVAEQTYLKYKHN